MINQVRHFYFNKYLVTPFSHKRYYLSYCLDYKALWYRVPKVATRTIDYHFKEHSSDHGYIYSSRVGYRPSAYRDYLKFAFVRNPLDRVVSAWKNKVVEANYFNFESQAYLEMQEFSNFINWLETQNLEKADEHLLPQHLLIDVEHLDYLGRFESFDEDFGKLAEKIGLPIEVIERKNPSKKMTIEIEPSTRMKVEQLYQKDYKLFNYSRQG